MHPDAPESCLHKSEPQPNLTATGELRMRCNLMRHHVRNATTALPAPDWITRAQLTELMEICKDELCPVFCDDIASACMATLIAVLTDSSGSTLTLEQWASLSLGLEQLIARIATIPISCGCTMSRAGFLCQILVNLEKTCRFAWARQTRSELVKIFARKIESISVDNPAMQDITLGKVSVEAGTPLPFLKASVELGYQSMNYVNDEGYVMQTRSGTVALGATTGVGLIGARGYILGGAGSLAYCRTALDHARYFFSDMLDDCANLPELTPWLSRAGAAGHPVVNNNEIRDFETIQNDFLILQERIAQYFSLLLSAPRARQTQGQACLEARPIFSQWQVQLRATPEKQARSLSGTVNTVAGSLGGTLSLGVLQASLTGESVTKTTTARRSRTMCELLKDPNMAAPAKQALIEKIRQASKPVWNSVLQFWSTKKQGQLAPENAQIIANLKQDLKSYTRLYAYYVLEQPGAAATLKSFHEKYCAKNKAEMLCNIALLIAATYARVGRQETGTKKEQLAAQLFELEQALYHCGIPQARQMLENTALARQQYQCSQQEKNVQFTVGTDLFGAALAQTVRISTWHLNHYESFAAGDYVRADFTLGASQEVNQQVLKSIADYFKTNIPGSNGFFSSSGYSRQGSYSVRYFRPSGFANRPYSKQYERIVVQETTQLGLSVPVPLPVPVHLQVGLGYSHTSTTMLSETTASESLFYFARHFMHARQTNKTDASGHINQDSYWHRLEREQRDAFEQLFLNYATGRYTRGALIDELDAIDHGLPLDPASRAKCLTARTRFLDCTERLLAVRSLENYEACMKEFKAMLNTYFPYWLKKRETSPVYRSWQVPLLQGKLI